MTKAHKVLFYRPETVNSSNRHFEKTIRSFEVINKKNIWILVVSTILAGTSSVFVIQELTEPLPSPASVKIPEFHGETFSRKQVKYGTPPIQIERKFQEISSWGKNSVLVYEITDTHQNTVILEAWRADPANSTIVEHAKTSFTMNWVQWIFSIDEVRFNENGVVVVTPKKDCEKATLVAWLVFVLSTICLISYFIKFLRAYYRPYAKLLSKQSSV